MLFSRSYLKVMPWKHQHEVWEQSASVVPNRNKGLLKHCYIYVLSVSVVPKRDNGLMTHCYIWVQPLSLIIKRSNGSLIYCYVWVRLMLIVPLLHVYFFCRKIIKITNRACQNKQKYKTTKHDFSCLIKFFSFQTYKFGQF